MWGMSVSEWARCLVSVSLPFEIIFASENAIALNETVAFRWRALCAIIYAFSHALAHNKRATGVQRNLRETLINKPVKDIPRESSAIVHVRSNLIALEVNLTRRRIPLFAFFAHATDFPKMSLAQQFLTPDTGAARAPNFIYGLVEGIRKKKKPHDQFLRRGAGEGPGWLRIAPVPHLTESATAWGTVAAWRHGTSKIQRPELASRLFPA